MHTRLATALALALAAVALAGCSGSPVAAPLASDATKETMTIAGLVQNEEFAPIAGAQVTLRFLNKTVTTDLGGAFAFRDLLLAPYLVDVAAAGFLNATLNAEPRANVSLSFVLVAPEVSNPPPVTVQFTGYFACAFEALIIPGSCDFFLNGTGQNVFDDQNVFVAGLGPRWATAVVDVDFDPQPGLDGLRVTVRAKNDADQLGTYEEYGKFHGTNPFTFRVEPGVTNPDGDRPVPANATSLQMDVYPQGYLWHPGGVPVLGVGAAVNVAFDLYVTVFFVEPAPEDFTLLP